MSRRRGFSLIDVIVGIALLLIVFVGLMGTLRATLAISALARAKGASLGLAESRMEYLRGLSYDALGTEGGNPAGHLDEEATTTIDGSDYGVHTTIVYNAPSDDYKIAEVVVSAYGSKAHTLSLQSTFAP